MSAKSGVIAVALITTVGTIIAAAVTGLFGLLSSGTASPEGKATYSASTEDADGPPPATTTRSSTSSSRGGTTTSSSVSGELAAVVGTWEGVYRCDKRRGLHLEIVPDSQGDADDLLATFTFFSENGNVGSPDGIYAMRGSYASEILVLKEDYWIDNPGAYYMVDLRAERPSGDPPVLSGVVDGGTGPCFNFELTRVSTDAKAPPI